MDGKSRCVAYCKTDIRLILSMHEANGKVTYFMLDGLLSATCLHCDKGCCRAAGRTALAGRTDEIQTTGVTTLFVFTCVGTLTYSWLCWPEAEGWTKAFMLWMYDFGDSQWHDQQIHRDTQCTLMMSSLSCADFLSGSFAIISCRKTQTKLHKWE